LFSLLIQLVFSKLLHENPGTRVEPDLFLLSNFWFHTCEMITLMAKAPYAVLSKENKKINKSTKVVAYFKNLKTIVLIKRVRFILSIFNNQHSIGYFYSIKVVPLLENRIFGSILLYNLCFVY